MHEKIFSTPSALTFVAALLALAAPAARAAPHASAPAGHGGRTSTSATPTNPYEHQNPNEEDDTAPELVSPVGPATAPATTSPSVGAPAPARITSATSGDATADGLVDRSRSSEPADPARAAGRPGREVASPPHGEPAQAATGEGIADERTAGEGPAEERTAGEGELEQVAAAADAPDEAAADRGIADGDVAGEGSADEGDGTTEARQAASAAASEPRDMAALAAEAAAAPAPEPSDAALADLDVVLSDGTADPISGVPDSEAARAEPDDRGPSRGEVRRALDSVRPSIRACVEGQRGRIVSVQSVFGSSGRTIHATVREGARYLSPAERSCVARATRSARVPSFELARFEVTFPVRF